VAQVGVRDEDTQRRDSDAFTPFTYSTTRRLLGGTVKSSARSIVTGWPACCTARPPPAGVSGVVGFGDVEGHERFTRVSERIAATVIDALTEPRTSSPHGSFDRPAPRSGLRRTPACLKLLSSEPACARCQGRGCTTKLGPTDRPEIVTVASTSGCWRWMSTRVRPWCTHASTMPAVA
jgi:hypothetical protein